MAEASKNRAVTTFWPRLHLCYPRLLGDGMCHPHFSDEKAEAEEKLSILPTLKAAI